MFDPISSAIADLQAGKMIIVVDSKDREDEGDLIMAAQFCTAEHVNFMITNARGLVCTPMDEHRAMKLSLPLMVRRNEEAMHTNFTVTCDLREGITTGTSAHDRAKTIQALADDLSVEGHFVSPGHIFPLISHPGGLSVRPGHTEATLKLLKMAKLTPVGVICEILRESGEMMKRDELFEFQKQHALKMISIEDLMKRK